MTELVPQVVVGTIVEDGVIRSEEENVAFGGVDYRAQWDAIRLQLGRTHADEVIRAHVEAVMAESPEMPSREANMKAISELWKVHQFKDRKLQYIMVDGQVKAIASTDHLLIPPEEVLEIAKLVMPEGRSWAGFENGLIQELKETLPGIRTGFQLDPGNIMTRRAIRMGFSVSVILCTNPLSFIGVGHLNRFKVGGWSGNDKILRVKAKAELADRIREALVEGKGGAGNFLETVEQSKKVHVTEDQAKTLLTAFPLAYSAGASTIKQVVARFQKEERTLWGMAQAASYVAMHGDFKKGAKNLDAGLATAGAAYIGITDVPETTGIAKKWLSEVKGIKDLSTWV